MFERLPTPWGLVRLGVAPDHPNIKAVSRVFEKVAQRPGFRFFGNVEIGTHLSAEELRSHYHAVVWSVGAQADRRHGDPRRGPARVARRDGVRGLVQRPPRLRRPRRRPRRGPHRRGRQRQRRGGLARACSR